MRVRDEADDRHEVRVDDGEHVVAYAALRVNQGSQRQADLVTSEMACELASRDQDANRQCERQADGDLTQHHDRDAAGRELRRQRHEGREHDREQDREADPHEQRRLNGAEQRRPHDEHAGPHEEQHERGERGRVIARVQATGGSAPRKSQ